MGVNGTHQIWIYEDTDVYKPKIEYAVRNGT